MEKEEKKILKNQEANKISILGVDVHPLTMEETLNKLERYFDSEYQHYVVTVNPEFILQAKDDSDFKNILNVADLAIVDGNGLIWADYFLNLPVDVPKVFSPEKQKIYKRRKIRNQLLYTLLLNVFSPSSLRINIPERVAGVDLVISLCEILSKKDRSLYLLGANNESSVAAKFELEKMFPDLIISGIKSGFNKEETQDELLIEAVNKAQPDVLLVALGHPYQEKWIYRNLDKIPSVKLAIGIGGTLDLIGKKKVRSPKILQKVNLEWAWRLVQEPSRWKRIKRAVYDFPKTVLEYKIKRIK